ncbi:uncharacterized protein LOC141855965 [Brevipalpus obovatus]|uniref:uncharacterized protein LOC141855965 n=1 Tax=Brevipalpus obovatus TaxID=246614 RepID=UPI003D9F6460
MSCLPKEEAKTLANDNRYEDPLRATVQSGLELTGFNNDHTERSGRDSVSDGVDVPSLSPSSIDRSTNQDSVTITTDEGNGETIGSDSLECNSRRNESNFESPDNKAKISENNEKITKSNAGRRDQSYLAQKRISDWVARSFSDKCQDSSQNHGRRTRRSSSSLSGQLEDRNVKKAKTSGPLPSEPCQTNPASSNFIPRPTDAYAPRNRIERSLSEYSSLSSSSSQSSSCSRHSIIKHYTDIIMKSADDVGDSQQAMMKDKITKILKSQWEDRLNRSKGRSSSDTDTRGSTSNAKTASFILRPSKLKFNKKTLLKLKKSNSRTDWIFSDTNSPNAE